MTLHTRDILLDSIYEWDWIDAAAVSTQTAAVSLLDEIYEHKSSVPFHFHDAFRISQLLSYQENLKLFAAPLGNLRC